MTPMQVLNLFATRSPDMPLIERRTDARLGKCLKQATALDSGCDRHGQTATYATDSRRWSSPLRSSGVSRSIA